MWKTVQSEMFTLSRTDVICWLLSNDIWCMIYELNKGIRYEAQRKAVLGITFILYGCIWLADSSGFILNELTRKADKQGIPKKYEYTCQLCYKILGKRWIEWFLMVMSFPFRSDHFSITFSKSWYAANCSLFFTMLCRATLYACLFLAAVNAQRWKSGEHAVFDNYLKSWSYLSGSSLHTLSTTIIARESWCIVPWFSVLCRIWYHGDSKSTYGGTRSADSLWQQNLQRLYSAEASQGWELWGIVPGRLWRWSGVHSADKHHPYQSMRSRLHPRGKQSLVVHRIRVELAPDLRHEWEWLHDCFTSLCCRKMSTFGYE